MTIDQNYFKNNTKESEDNVGEAKIPLVRYLTLTGAVPCRRASADAILNDRVCVDGRIVGQPSFLVCRSQAVVVDGVPVDPLPLQHVHIMLHKPPGTLCSRSGCDYKQYKGGIKKNTGRPSVYDLITNVTTDCVCQSPQHVFPIGRLDVDTTGLLLFTSDGMLNEALTNPDNKVEKWYRATLRDTRRPLSDEALQQLAHSGVSITPGRNKPPVTVRGRASNTETVGVVDLVITSGYHHQVKQMLRAVGRPLDRLHRVAFAGLVLDGLDEGACRLLHQDEIDRLYAMANSSL